MNPMTLSTKTYMVCTIYSARGTFFRLAIVLKTAAAKIKYVLEDDPLEARNALKK